MKLLHALLPLVLLGGVSTAYANDTANKQAQQEGKGIKDTGRQQVKTQPGGALTPIEDKNTDVQRGIEKIDIQQSPSMTIKEKKGLR